MTKARLEANRRNARKSTGPRTAAGKARSRMNGLRHGGRSPEYLGMFTALGDAAPGAILRVGEACLTPAQRMHPVYVGLLEMFTQVEADMVEAERRRWNQRRNFSESYDRSLNVV
jgi:hypothetical protein